MHYFVIFLQSHFTFFHSCCDKAVSLIFSTNKQLSQNIVLGRKCSQVHVLLPYTVNHCSFKCEVVISTTWGPCLFPGQWKGSFEYPALYWVPPTHTLLCRHYYPHFIQEGTNDQREEPVQGHIMQVASIYDS